MELTEYTILTKEGTKTRSFPQSISPSKLLQAFQFLGAFDVWNNTEKCQEFLSLEYHHAIKGRFSILSEIYFLKEKQFAYRTFPFSFDDMSLPMAAKQAKNNLLAELKSKNILLADVSISCKELIIVHRHVSISYPASPFSCLHDLFDDL